MLRVSRSGYYAWRRRGPSRRAIEDARLGTLVVAAHREGRGTYGSPRILDDIREAGEHVSRKRVARLMKERNLVGEPKKRWRHPSSAPSDAVCAPNTLDRAFDVAAPNRVWASDITYVRTWEGWLYLARQGLAIEVNGAIPRSGDPDVARARAPDRLRIAETPELGVRVGGPAAAVPARRHEVPLRLGADVEADDPRVVRAIGPDRLQVQGPVAARSGFAGGMPVDVIYNIGAALINDFQVKFLSDLWQRQGVPAGIDQAADRVVDQVLAAVKGQNQETLANRLEAAMKKANAQGQGPENGGD
jgi:hypothetical protein